VLFRNLPRVGAAPVTWEVAVHSGIIISSSGHTIPLDQLTQGDSERNLEDAAIGWHSGMLQHNIRRRCQMEGIAPHSVI
jgi:hypothetical protein